MAQISDAHVLKMSAARDLVLMLYSLKINSYTYYALEQST